MSEESSSPRGDSGPGAGSGTPPGSLSRKAVLARTVAIVVVLLSVNYLMVAGLGLLLTEVVGTETTPVDGEETINESLAENRSAELNDVTHVLSGFGNTITIIATLVLVGVAVLLLSKQWRPSLFLVAAVAGQALVFLLVTLTISRQRPDVPMLDSSPPTSSYPSGHIGASTALYLGCALLLLWLLRSSRLQGLAVLLLVCVPLLVTFARLYRGMHHPTDVLGAYLNGAACLLIASGVILGRGPLGRFRQSRRADAREEGTIDRQAVGSS
jgi:undecaprenyl-diphosphatase